MKHCKQSIDLCITKGSDYLASIELFNDDDTLMDLSGKTAKLVIREKDLHSSPLILEKDCTIDSNKIVISLPFGDTELIKQNDGYYNLYLINSVESRSIVLRGRFTINDGLL